MKFDENLLRYSFRLINLDFQDPSADDEEYDKFNAIFQEIFGIRIEDLADEFEGADDRSGETSKRMKYKSSIGSEIRDCRN